MKSLPFCIQRCHPVRRARRVHHPVVAVPRPFSDSSHYAILYPISPFLPRLSSSLSSPYKPTECLFTPCHITIPPLPLHIAPRCTPATLLELLVPNHCPDRPVTSQCHALVQPIAIYTIALSRIAIVSYFSAFYSKCM